MDDLDRFFPVIPRNVPADNLDSYLRMYADEAGAFRDSQRSSGETHAEWFVNTRMPVMRTLQGLGIVGQPIGDDPMRATNLQASTELVDATWAQRAANAALAVIGAAPIQVDGLPGTQTITTLRFLMLRWYAAQSHTAVAPDTGQTTVGSFPMPFRSGTHTVTMANAFYRFLTGLTQVADPPTTPRAPSPGPSSPPVDATYPDQGIENRPGGFFTGTMIGMLALVGLGAYALSRR